MVRGLLVLMWGVHIGTLYINFGRNIIDRCNSYVFHECGEKTLVVSREKTVLWHQRPRHIGENGLQIIHGYGMVEGMSNFSLDFDFYKHCVYGKQNRVIFPSAAKRAKGILELMHNDVFNLC